MTTSFRRYALGALALLTMYLVAGSCADDTAGPSRGRAGHFAVVPRFQSANAGAIDFAAIRFVLRRTSDSSVAKDTVVTIVADQDSVDLALTVPVMTPGETFLLTLAVVDTQGDTVFRGGPVTVTPSTSAGSTPVVPIEIVYVGTGFDAAGVQILTTGVDALTGDEVQFVGVALDSSEQAIPGTPIYWSSLDTAIARVPEADSGRVVAGAQRGTARIVATLLTGQADTGAIAVQPLPTSIVTDSGNGQTAVVGTTLPQALVARLVAGDGQGVSGQWVRFILTQGNGSLSADSAQTDATGRASVALTLGTGATPHVVQATAVRLPGQNATFTTTAQAGPPETIVADAGDAQSAVVGTAVPIPPAVMVTDANGNPVPGVSVTFEIVSGGGALTGSLPSTGPAGIATVGSWTLGTTPGVNQLRAFLTNFAGVAGRPSGRAAERSDGTVTGNARDSVADFGAGTDGADVGALVAAPTDTVVFTATASAGAAGALVLVNGDGQGGTVGVPLADSLVVRAEDAFANPVGGAQVAWAVTLGTGNVSSDTVVTDGAGLAAVEWQLGTVAGTGHEVVATLVGTSATQTFTATAAPGAPNAVAFVTQPSDALADSVITPAVEVEILDQFGNRVTPDNTTDVDIGITSGTGTGGAALSGTTTRTAVAGLVTFDDLSIDLAGTAYTLDASIPSLTLATSAPFDITVPAGAFVWTNGSGGDWTDGTNWDRGAAPGLSDTAYITLDGTYTVTLDQPDTVAALYLGGASGTQSLTDDGVPGGALLGVTDTANVGVNGFVRLIDGFNASGGFVIEGRLELGGDHGGLAGVTLVAAGGTLALHPALGGGTLNLVSRTLRVAGTLDWDKAVVLNLLGGTLDIQPGGVAAWTGNAAVTGSGGVQNAGLFQMAAQGVSVSAPFVNLAGGVLDVQSGSNFLSGNFTHSAGAVLQGSATLDVSGATVLAFDGDLNPGTSAGLLSLVPPAGLTLGANAVVNIELGADPTVNPPGVDNDFFRSLTELLGLGGTLNVTLIAPYVPNGTETWPLLAGVSGAFAQVNLPPLDLPWTTFLQSDTLYLGPPPAAGPPTWTGAVSTNWFDAGNWDVGVVPNSETSDVVIPAGPAQMPVLTANVVVRDLLVQAGASIDVGTFNLTAWGTTVDALGTISGTGFVSLQGDPALAQGQFPNLEIQGNVALSGDLTVSDTVSITGSGARLDLNGQKATVGDRFRTASSAELVMQNAADTLDIGGLATFDAAMVEGNLTDGDLLARGDFVVGSSACCAFNPTLNHRVTFVGTTPQNVSFSSPGNTGGATNNQRFREVIFDNPTTVTLSTDAWASANVQVSDGTLNLGANTFDAAGPSFSTALTGTLTMLDPAATLNVAGSAAFFGASTANLLEAGTINVSGNLSQSGPDPDAFHAGGTHTVNFVGSGQHFINIQDSDIGPGVPSSHFANITVSGTGSVLLSTDVFAHSTLTVPSGVAATIADPAGVAGPGHKLAVGGVDVDGMTLSHIFFEYNGMATFPSLGTFTLFDNVTFNDYLDTEEQLRIVHPGAATPFTLDGLTFTVTPATGAYIFAADSLVDGNTLTVDLTNSTPLNGSALTNTSGGAVVNWPGSGTALLVSHWAGDGNAVDSADGNDGILVGGTTFATGLRNQAFSFDGVDDLVNVGNATNLQLSDGAFSVSAWSRANTANVDLSLVDKMTGTNANGWRLLRQQDNGYWFCLGGGGSNGCTSGTATTVQTAPLAVATWYHVVAVKTLDSIAIYLDGALVQQKPLPAFTDNQANDLLIGGYAGSGSSSFMNGEIDDVRIYAGALTATQIDSIFTSITPQNLNAWTGGAGDGLWSSAANWSKNAVPVATDSVVIDLDGTYTVTLDQAATVASLIIDPATGTVTFAVGANTLDITTTGLVGPNALFQMQTGSLTGTGTVSVEGTLAWPQGSMSGTGLTRVEPGGTLALSGSASKVLDARTIENDGTVTWDGSGGILGSNGATILNNVGGTVSVSASGGFSGATFDNQGTLIRTTANASATTFGGTFLNTGSVDIQSGAIFMGGTSSWSGSASVSGQTLGFFDGTHTWNDGFSSTGPVLIESTAVVTVPGAATVTLDQLSMTFSGTLTGDGTVSITGSLTWTGGTMSGGGITRLENLSSGTISGGGAKTLDTRTFDNFGSVTWTGGNLTVSNAGTITNRPGATFDVPTTVTTAILAGAGGGTVNNSGTFRKAAGGSTFTVGVVYNDSGTTTIQDGELNFAATSSHTTPLAIPAGASIVVSLGTHTFDDTISGAGTLVFNSGTNIVNGAYELGAVVVNSGNTTFSGSLVTLDSIVTGFGTNTFDVPDTVRTAILRHAAGTLTGTAPLLVTDALDWSGGAQSGSGSTVIGPTGTAVLSTTTTKSTSRPFVNRGTIDVLDGTLDINGALEHVGGAVLQGGGIVDIGGATLVATDGDVQPGTSPGVLTVSAANYPLAAAATLRIELAGAGGVPGTDFDEFRLTAGATLDGTLAVDTIGGFVPTAGDVFPIVTTTTGSITVGGTFAVTLPALTGVTLDTAFSAARDTLYIVALTPPPTNLNAWTGGADDGLWSSAGNWSKNAAPISTDSVVIDLDGSYGIALDAPVTVEYLMLGAATGTQTLSQSGNTLTVNSLMNVATNGVYGLNGGTFTGTGDLTVGGVLFWTSGTMTGSGAVTVGGTGSAVLSGSGGGTTHVVDRAITFEGTVTWDGGAGSGFITALQNGNIVTFGPTAQVAWNGDLGFNDGGGGGSIVNNGLIMVTNAGDPAVQQPCGAIPDCLRAAVRAGVTFTNNDFVDVVAGPLALENAATTATHTGGFNIAAGALLSVGGGTHTFSGPVGGTGILEVAGASAAFDGALGAVLLRTRGGDGSVNATWDGPAIVATAGTLAFANTATVTATLDSVVLTGATVTFNSGGPIGVTELRQSGGILAGADNVLLNGAGDWTGGIQTGTGTTVVGGTATLTWSNGTLNARTLSNQGTVDWTGSTLFQGAWSVTNAGLWDIQGDFTTGLLSSTGTFTSNGTLQKSAGAGTAAFTIPTVVNGILDIQSGTFAIGSSASLNGAGTLRGIGTLDATASDGTGALAGTIAPGDQSASFAGILSWTGVFDPDPSAVLAIDLGGTVVGTEHDRFDVSQTVVHDGTLQVTLQEPFIPADGQQFPVMTFESATGEFATLAFPTVGNLVFDTLTVVDNGGTLDTLYVTVTDPFAAAPPGTEAIWTGEVSTDWFAAANWDVNAVPTATTNVFIPAGTLNAPVVSGGLATTDFLVLQDGATLTVSADNILSISGRAEVGYSSLAGSGIVELAGAGQTVSGSFSNLTILGTYTAADSVLVGGTLTVDGGNLDLGGQRVSAGGSLTTSGGTFTMQNALDSLIVAGNATFDGGGTSTLLSNGVFLLQGDFTQTSTNSVNSFTPSGAHLTVLNGTTQQNVSFASPANGLSRFQNLEVANPGGVSLSTTVHVTGNMDVTAAAPITGVDSLRVKGAGGITSVSGSSFTLNVLEINGPLSAQALNFAVDTVVFAGSNQTITDSLPYGDVFVQSVGFPATVAFGGPTSIGGSVVIQGTGAELDINGQTVSVGGNFTVGSGVGVNGNLIMQPPAGNLIVQGDALFRGASSTDLLTAGTLELQGSFTQDGIPAVQTQFAPSGTHTVILSGGAGQSVSFEDANGSNFHNVDIQNTGGTQFGFTGRVTGNLDVTSGQDFALGGGTLTVLGDFTSASTILGGGTVNIGGALTAAAGGYAVTNTVFTGTAQSIPAALPYTNVEVSGTASFTGATTIAGNLLVSGAGNATVGANTVAVSGDLQTTDSGTFTMAADAGTLDVSGNAVISGGNTNGQLTAGTLQIGNDFTQLNTTTDASFAASGTHLTRFVNGANLPNAISFASPGAGVNQSHFQLVEFANNLAAKPNSSLNSLVNVNGNLTATGGAQVGGTGIIMVAGDLTVTGSTSEFAPTSAAWVAGALTSTGTFSPGITVFNGPDQAIPSGPNYDYNAVTVRNTAAFAAGVTDTIPGALTVGAAGALDLNGATIRGTSLLTQLSGTLTMNAAADSLILSGAATFDGASTAGLLTAGYLEVGGDFTQTSTNSPASFSASGTHLTAITASSSMQFQSAGAAASHFNDARVSSSAAATIVAVSDTMYVVGDLTVVSVELFTVLGGGVATVEGDVTLLSANASIDLDTLRLGGRLDPGLGSLTSNTVEFFGTGQTIPAMTYTNVLVTGDSVVFSNLDITTVSTDLTVDGTGLAHAGPGAVVTVGNNLSTAGGGALRMDDFDASITVNGDAIFNGGSTENRLTAGTLIANSDFFQSGGGVPTSFAASGSHEVLLNATGVVSFADPGTAASRFGNLRISGTGKSTFNSTTVVAGTMTLQTGGLAAIPTGTTLDINGALTQSSGATIEGTGTLDVADFTTNASRVTLNGDLSPGGSGVIDALNVRGHVAMGASARYLWDHDGTNTANRDLIAVTGSFQAGGTLVGNEVTGTNDFLGGFTIVTATLDADDGVFSDPGSFVAFYQPTTIVVSYQQF